MPKSEATQLLANRDETECAIIVAILHELDRAKAKHPHWPTDAVHASAILAEESGELVQASLDFHYSGGTFECLARIEEEAIQCGAMSIRTLLNLHTYGDAAHKRGTLS